MKLDNNFRSTVTHLLSYLFFVIIISCGDSKDRPLKECNEGREKIIRNRDNRTNFVLNLKNKCEIKLNDDFIIPNLNTTKYGIFSKEESFFILNKSNNLIYQYSKKGNFIKTFGGRGLGPGEYISPSEFGIIGDTMFVYDTKNNNIVRFTTDGLFVDNIMMTPRNKLTLPKIIDNKLIVGNNIRYLKEDRNIFMIVEAIVYNSQFVPIKILKEYKIDFERKKPINPIKIPIMKFVCGSKEFYLSERSVDSYNIFQYDIHSLNESLLIEKSYRKILYHDDELLELNKKLKHLSQEFKKVYKTNSVYKNSISELFVDKYNRLWVESASNDFNVLDLFEAGRMIGKIIIPNNIYTKDMYLDLYKDKLVIYDVHNNIISFYQYEY